MERCLEHDVPGCTLCAKALALPSRAVEGIVVSTPSQPTLDPAKVYLSRFTTATSRRTMLGSLRIIASLLLNRDVAQVQPQDLSAVPWHTIHYAHAQALRNKLMEKGYSAKTTNKHLVALRGILQECARLGVMTREAAAASSDIQVVRGSSVETGRRLTPEEISKLFASCGATSQGKRDMVVLALTLGGGLRRSEVANLKRDDWDATERRLKVLGKGNKWRTVYLSKKHAEMVESWLATKKRTIDAARVLHGQSMDDEWLLNPTTKWGTLQYDRKLTENGVYDVLKALAARAGVEHFTPHDLRRTYITQMLEKGGDALTVSKMAGHSNVQTTMGYDRRGEAAKKMLADLE